MFYFSKLLYKKFSPNTREDGVIYANNMARYLSILIDLFLLMILMRCYQFCFATIFHSWLGSMDFNIMKKAQLDINMSKDEILQLSEFKTKYLIMNISQMLVLPLYFYFPWYYLGGSIGQILLGLRIVQEKGCLVLTKTIVIKRFFACITMVATLMFGFLWSFVDKKRQSLHDKISRTVVVTKRSLRKQGVYNPRYDIFDIMFLY
jgi:uncharacterized RDD family membrane protein YckC